MNDILRISLPLTVWIAAFSAVYGLEGVVCSDHWTAAGLDAGHGRAALIAAWAAALALQAALIICLRMARFASDLPWVQRVGAMLAWAGLIATGWSLMPVMATSLCL